MTTVSVLIPARNEESTVGEVIARHLEVLEKCITLKYIDDYEVIILNDGSSDNTSKNINLFQGSNKLSILSNETSSGLQNAFEKLYRASSMSWVYLTPGDGQIPATNLEKFITKAHLSNWTCAILGNRNKIKQYGLSRLSISFLFRMFSSFILSRNIPDIGTVKLVPSILNHQDYKCKSVLQEIERVQFLDLFKFPIQIVDIEWIARKKGKSRGVSTAELFSVLREIRLLKRNN